MQAVRIGSSNFGCHEPELRGWLRQNPRAAKLSSSIRDLHREQTRRPAEERSMDRNSPNRPCGLEGMLRPNQATQPKWRCRRKSTHYARTRRSIARRATTKAIELHISRRTQTREVANANGQNHRRPSPDCCTGAENNSAPKDLIATHLQTKGDAIVNPPAEELFAKTKIPNRKIPKDENSRGTKNLPDEKSFQTTNRLTTTRTRSSARRTRRPPTSNLVAKCRLPRSNGKPASSPGRCCDGEQACSPPKPSSRAKAEARSGVLHCSESGDEMTDGDEGAIARPRNPTRRPTSRSDHRAAVGSSANPNGKRRHRRRLASIMARHERP